MATKIVNSIAFTANGTDVVKLDVKPIKDDVKKIQETLGLGAEGPDGEVVQSNVAFTDKPNDFSVTQKYKQGIEFDKTEHDNLVVKTTETANANVNTAVGVNMTVKSSDNKKFGSVVVGVQGTKRTSQLVVNKNDGEVGGAIKIECDGTKTTATAPMPELKTAPAETIMTFGAVKTMFKDLAAGGDGTGTGEPGSIGGGSGGGSGVINPDTGEPQPGANPLIPFAAEDKFGIIRIATQSDVTKATSKTCAITPVTLKSSLAPILEKIDKIQSGNVNFAYKDYTQSVNQSEMLEGQTYIVFFNKKNEYLELDPATNQPKNPQPTTSTTDLVIHYYKTCYKASSGSVTIGAPVYTQANLQGVSYVDRANTYTGTNTFNGAVTATAGITANEVTVDSSVTVEAGGQKVANASKVKKYVDSFIPQLVTAIPDVGVMKKNVIYFEHEA